MSKGKRYDTEPKLNIKKVLGVVIAVVVIIMIIISVVKTINNDKNLSSRFKYKLLYSIF